MVDQVLGLVTVLLTFAVGIALLGITNTLACPSPNACARSDCCVPSA
jgi:hypothetical protein